MKETQHSYPEYLLTAAELNDELLQAYRTIQLTLQSIFLAVAAGLTVATISFENRNKVVLSAVMLIAFAFVGLWILSVLRRVIIARGEDVSFWHRKLVKAEQDLPPKARHFTEFKVHQKLYRADAEYLRQMFLTIGPADEPDIDHLIERGLGHTRKILDKWLSRGIQFIWIVLVMVAVLYTLWLWLPHQ